jgi:hypothetical protein
MAQPTTSASIEALIDRAADLKGELVAFAQSPRFRKWLDVLLRDSADDLGYLDEGMAVHAMDRFALQHRLPDGRTVVERFVAQRRPPLSDDERELVLGWGDVVEGCFEVRGGDGEAVELHNLLDDLVYRVHSNMGPPALAPLRPGTFAVCRIVPLRRATDDWLISGHISIYAASARRRLAQVAVEHVTANPALLRRNPALFERSWEVQAEQRAVFIAQVGADLVVLPPLEAQETLREHHRRIRSQAVARLKGKAVRRARTAGRLPEDAGRLPEELLDADSVALVYDEIEGLGYYRDFGRLDALFADPPQARDRADLAQLRAYLDDESVPPLVIRRLVERHPGGADQIFRTLLRKPGFTWSRDGEKLLRREKKSYFDREPVPSVSIIGQRLVELLG